MSIYYFPPISDDNKALITKAGNASSLRITSLAFDTVYTTFLEYFNGNTRYPLLKSTWQWDHRGTSECHISHFTPRDITTIGHKFMMDLH
jgi:hypothetical protein